MPQVSGLFEVRCMVNQMVEDLVGRVPMDFRRGKLVSTQMAG